MKDKAYKRGLTLPQYLKGRDYWNRVYHVRMFWFTVLGGLVVSVALWIAGVSLIMNLVERGYLN